MFLRCTSDKVFCLWLYDLNLAGIASQLSILFATCTMWCKIKAIIEDYCLQKCFRSRVIQETLLPQEILFLFCYYFGLLFFAPFLSLWSLFISASSKDLNSTCSILEYVNLCFSTPSQIPHESSRNVVQGVWGVIISILFPYLKDKSCQPMV